jgi:hypothetical protein
LALRSGPIRLHYRQKINTLVYQRSSNSSRRAILNGCSEISLLFQRNVLDHARFNSREMSRRTAMKNLGYAIAALGVIAVAAPSIASAETVVIKRGGYHHDWDRARAEYRVNRGWHDRGWHEGWRHHHDKVVIVKHRY